MPGRLLDSFCDERGAVHVVELVGRQVVDRGPGGQRVLVAELSPYEGEPEARGAVAEYRRHPRPALRLNKEGTRCPAR